MYNNDFMAIGAIMEQTNNNLEMLTVITEKLVKNYKNHSKNIMLLTLSLGVYQFATNRKLKQQELKIKKLRKEIEELKLMRGK